MTDATPYTSPHALTKSITLSSLKKMKAEGERFVVLTVYDASFAAILERAGVEMIFVGDSLGMVIQGHDTTVPVTVDDVIYHTQHVARVRQHALLMADMPFMSFRDPGMALENATRLMQEGGAHVVKLEGTGPALQVAEALAGHDIPVCAHLGLQPQSIHKLGAYRVQGRDAAGAEAMVQQAVDMQNAGADLLLLECVPASLAKRITETLTIPTIGIGAGVHCDAQVLVLYDVLGISYGRLPKFSKNFLVEQTQEPGIEKAVSAYVQAVKNGSFPAAEHSFD